ncbi:hypothetical protein P167DRAFT_566234 [Morchella conica CCBAS932]|uniref:Opioid growth factor receptor (OGFr) conserved domain-containing protein n=1 Tax=Morchella conica CCBAS932 TaxID=1392247 RepID=A0A3N4KK41_9PEZI|nr:hypothetical protein P167DRAFT_566234 [Morchella conica CCBAS932]
MGAISKLSTKRADPPKSFLASLTPVAPTNGASTAAINLSSTSNNKNNSAPAAAAEGGTRSGANSEEDQCQEVVAIQVGADSGPNGPPPKTLTIPTATNRLISFYTHPNGGTDSEDRTLSEILRFPDRDLEYHHDYIQWLFPLPEASPFNRSAPRIDRHTAEAFRTRPELRGRMRESLVRMLEFYGFEAITTAACGFEIREASEINFQRRARFWLCRFDHNHLRITRIIRCLRVLGLEHEAREFHKVLVRAATPEPGGRTLVGQNTLKFWKRAAMRPLEVEPADEEFDDEEYERNGGGGGEEANNNGAEDVEDNSGFRNKS